MASKFPRDYPAVTAHSRWQSPAQYTHLRLAQWTASSTVVDDMRFIARDRCVIREVWFCGSAIPAGGAAITLNVKVFDVINAADDTIVSAFDATTMIVANKAYKAVFAAETSANERTLEAGDSIRVELVAAGTVTTNASVTALIVWQALVGITK